MREIVTAPSVGVITSITGPNQRGKWTVLFRNNAGEIVTFAELDEVYVVGCRSVGIGELIGARNGEQQNSGNYIHNQFAAAQAGASYWIGGNGRTDGYMLSGGGYAATGDVIPVVGPSLNMSFNRTAEVGVIAAYNSTDQAWLGINYNALSHTFSVNNTEALAINPTGVVRIKTLAADTSGNRVVMADTNGVLYAGVGGYVTSVDGVVSPAVDSLSSALSMNVTAKTTDPRITLSWTGARHEYVRGDGSLFVPRNGLNTLTNVIEFGGDLLHDTNLYTGYHQMTFSGLTVYDYPYEFQQGQRFGDGTGIVSFRSAGSPFTDNKVRLGVNYTDAVITLDASNNNAPIPGYFGDKVGYLFSVNMTGTGTYGMRVDDHGSKIGGLLIHTKDVGYTDSVTIFGQAPPATTDYVGVGTQSATRIATFHHTKDLQLFGYTSSRSDGTTAKALYVDANGMVKYGNVLTSGTVTSVAASIPTGALSIGGSPITSTGTLAFSWTGTGAQFVRGDGSFADFSGTADYVARWTSATAIGIGAIRDNGLNVSIGGVPDVNYGFSVNGPSHFIGDTRFNASIRLTNEPTSLTTGFKHLIRDNTDGSIRVIAPKYPTGLTFTGTSTKTLTITLADGTTVSNSFTDIEGTAGTADGNNFTSSIGFNTATGDFTNQRNGLATLTQNLDGRYLPISEIKPLTGIVVANTGAAIGAVAGTASQVLRRNAANNGYEFYTLPAYLTSFTEADPIANAKTITLTQGAGIAVTGAAQTVGNNPSFTIAATKYPTALAFTGTTTKTLTITLADNTTISNTFASGTVTSVQATATGALSFSGGPITGAGTLALAWGGTTAQYVRGDGSLETFPTLSGTANYLARWTGANALGVGVVRDNAAQVGIGIAPDVNYLLSVNGSAHLIGDVRLGAALRLTTEPTAAAAITFKHLVRDTDGLVKSYPAKHPTGIAFTGTSTKTLTITLADGTTVSNSFTDIEGTAGTSDGNNFPSGLNFDVTTGNLTIARNGLTNLISSLDGRYLPISEIKPLTGIVVANTGGTITAVAGGASQLLRRKADNSGYEFFTPSYITGEADPIANAKTVTITQGAGIGVTGVAQTIGNNPSFTIASTKHPTSLAFTGTTTKTLTITLADGSTISNTFADMAGSNAGTVTSVQATASGALQFSGGPITTDGTLSLEWTGSNSGYVRGDGTVVTFPNVILNGTELQNFANFNISGNGIIGGYLLIGTATNSGHKLDVAGRTRTTSFLVNRIANTSGYEGYQMEVSGRSYFDNSGSIASPLTPLYANALYAFNASLTTADTSGVNTGWARAASLVGADYNINGAMTVVAAAGVGASVNVLRMYSTGNTANSVTMTQGASGNIRAMAAAQFYTHLPANPSGSQGTISHLAGAVIHGPDRNGTNSHVVTNYYGLVINGSNERTLTITNRYGIYQVGQSDTNFLDGPTRLGRQAGTGTRLMAADSTGLISTIANSTNGYVLTLVNGTPSWAQIPQQQPTNDCCDEDRVVSAYRLLGSKIVAQTIGLTFFQMNSTVTLNSGFMRFVAVYLEKPSVITAARFMIRANSDYVASGYNGVALYSYANGTLTKRASSPSIDDIWKTSSLSHEWKVGYFDAPYSAPAGMYYVGFMFSGFGVDGEPGLFSYYGSSTDLLRNDFQMGAVLAGIYSSGTTLPNSFSMSSGSGVVPDTNYAYAALISDPL